MSEPLQSYLDRQDAKSGNTLGGDLWRLAMEAQRALEVMRLEIQPALALEQQLKKQIEAVERRWKRELQLESEATERPPSPPG